MKKQFYGVAIFAALLIAVLSALLFAARDSSVTLHGADAVTASREAVSYAANYPSDLPALPAGATESWVAAVENNPELERFGVRPVDLEKPTEIEANYWAPNPIHGIDTWFTLDGIEVRPHRDQVENDLESTAGDSWSFNMSLAGIGAPGDVQKTYPVVHTVDSNRVEFRRGNLIEWYVNDGNGLEQGFTIEAPPAGVTDELWLALNIDSSLQSRQLSEEMVAFVQRDGKTNLYLRGLYVEDANATELAARFATNQGQIGILVDVADAIYPIVVDPIISALAQTLFINEADSDFGRSVASAGDVNGDGYIDLLVGAPLYDNGETDEGGAFLFLGGPAGFSSASDWQAESDQADAQFGFSVAGAGDVDCDGYSDVIVGAPLYDNGETDEGAVFVYLGQDDVGGTLPPLTPAPGWPLDGGIAGANYGWSVDSAGNTDSNSCTDIIVGAPFYDVAGGGIEGAAFVYLGSLSGISTTPAAGWPVLGVEHDDQFGKSVAGVGDVTGSGYDDVAVTEQQDECTLTCSGPDSTFLYESTGSGPLATHLSDVGGQAPVAAAGDVNGDGFADVLASSGNSTETYLFYGSATGISHADSIEFSTVGEDAIGTAGDLNGDGFSDVYVSHDGFNAGDGKVDIFLGGSGGLATTASTSVVGFVDGGHLGISAAALGDYDNDGFSDLAVGLEDLSSNNLSPPIYGAVVVYRGESSGASVLELAGSSADPRDGAPAGDVNGDGYGDWLQGYPPNFAPSGAELWQGNSGGSDESTPLWSVSGPPEWWASAFGNSVTALDFNGDNYMDMAIADSGHDAGGFPAFPDNGTNEGAVHIYLGSALGLPAVPDWSIIFNQAGANFGERVSSAGDINGDGNEDLLVWADGYDVVDDEGAAFIYLGSPSGPAASSDWQLLGTTVDERFGERVVAAGDINADGFDDVIAGKPEYQNGEANEGIISVYLGSPTGLPVSSDWELEGDVVDLSLGESVAAAGDINRDGYGDVLAGIPGFLDIHTENGNPEVSYGGAYLFLGGADGFADEPDQILYSTVSNSPQPSSLDRFGSYLSAIGDIDGDGYGDVIVSPKTALGVAQMIYRGSASQLLMPAISFGTQQDNGRVSQAGDVNGDGLGDFITDDKGLVISQQGSEAIQNPRQLIAPAGASILARGSSLDLFTVEATSKLILADNVKLEVEACLQPADFGDAVCTTTESLSWEPQLIGGSAVSVTVNPVNQVIYGQSNDPFPVDGLYRWRARLRSDTDPVSDFPWKPIRSVWRHFQGDVTASAVDIVIDFDGDGVRNSLDLDDDNPLVGDDPFDPDIVTEDLDENDAFPQDNTEVSDLDADGTGDNADTDDDGDGTADGSDPYRLTPSILLTGLSVAESAPPGVAYNADADVVWTGPGRDTGWYTASPVFTLQKFDTGVWVTLTVDGSNFIQDAELGWLQFNSATGELTGFPQAANVGTYTLRLAVTDGAPGGGFDWECDPGCDETLYFDVNGDGSVQQRFFNFTLDIPADDPPNPVTIDPLGQVNGYLTAKPLITGTAADPTPNLSQVDVRISGSDATYWDGSNFTATDQWVGVCTVSGPETCATWTADTTLANYEDEVLYTVEVRATDAAANETIVMDSFTYYGDDPVFTTLQLTLSTTSMLLDGEVDINVSLNVPGDPNPLPFPLPVTVTVTDPDAVATDIELMTDTNGLATYTALGEAGSPVQFNVSGDWQISASFAGEPEYPQYLGSSADPVPLLVGSSPGYAVIVQGKVETEDGLDAHNKTANRMYRTMLGRSLRDQDIFYFNHDHSQDANQDGQPDNSILQNGIGVDAVPDKATIQATIEGLGALVQLNPGPIWIALHDHGNLDGASAKFQLDYDTTLNQEVIITPAELSQWVDVLYTSLQGYAAGLDGMLGTGDDPFTMDDVPIILVNGYCYSGAFVPALSGPGRVVIASAAADEVSYKGPEEDDLIRVGEYFLEALFEGLEAGQDLNAAFSRATAQTEEYTRKEDNLSVNGVAPYFDDAAQHPLLDDNGDLIGSNTLSAADGGDGLVAKGIKLGVGLDSDVNSLEAPATIVETSPTIFLPEGAGNVNALLELRANNNNQEVAAAIIEVRAPGTELDFGIQGSEQLEAGDYDRRLLGNVGCTANFLCLDYDQFTTAGKYEVNYYVQDVETGDLSPRERSVVYKQLALNQPPSAPSLIDPLDGAVNVPLIYGLEWARTTVPEDPENNAVTYTLRVATDAAMTNVVYTAEEIPVTFHVIPPNSGLSNNTTYYWDVTAIDFYGASSLATDSWCTPGVTPCSFTTVQSANNTTGLIRGVIRGLTASNTVLTQLNGAAMAQTNGTPEQVFVHYDDVYDLTVYAVETQAGTIDLQATATSFGFQNKTSIDLSVGETIDNEDFLLLPADADADGIPDETEDVPPNVDSDSDGTPDYLDTDSDNDGIGDSLEAGGVIPRDTDGDGTPDYLDSDSDNDGVPDKWEVGANPNNAKDRDHDGIPDYRDADSIAWGDVRVDNTLNVKDIILLEQGITGVKILNGAQFQRGDIFPPGGDGVINSKDLLTLQEILAP